LAREEIYGFEIREEACLGQRSGLAGSQIQSVAKRECDLDAFCIAISNSLSSSLSNKYASRQF
jgi:hypothetical protein